jgi:multiple sugar transport system ATP-binding protein
MFLRLEGVYKRFGRHDALQDVHLEVGDDELLVVLGPTGAGKTTLLRLVAGLESPDAGRVLMKEQDVTRETPAARDVALVFQNFSLYPRWTVRRNLEFPLRAPGRNLPEEEIRRRVEDAADLLKIREHLDRESQRLSGGQMQRVAIGRAIVRRPRIFLFDEPLTNLDAKLRESLRVELVQMRRQLKIPMVFVTHDQSEALSMADRIVVLSGGRVLQTGTPEEIYRKPVSPVVAAQLGQPAINLLKVRSQHGAWTTENGDAVLPAPAGAPAVAVLGLRPEDVAPVGGPLPGRVKVVEHMGPTKTLLVEWAGHEIHLSCPHALQAVPGDTIHPRPDPARTLVWPGC